MSRPKRKISSKNSSLDDLVIPLLDSLKPLQEGENILVQTGSQISLLKYECAQAGDKNPLRVKLNRRMEVYCIGNLVMAKKNDPYTHKDPSKRIVGKARVEILGTHRIDFSKDGEFGIYLPSARDHTDLYLTLAHEFANGRIEVGNNLTIISDESSVRKKLQEITRPQYFNQNILPFLENKATDLKLPNWNQKNTYERFLEFFKRFKSVNRAKKPLMLNFSKAQDWLSDVSKNLNHGDFVYVGSKEEVYLLSIAKNKDDSLYKQGTYTTSARPIFWFSNNYLGNMNARELCTTNTPSFNGQPFIFGAMGREQNCKNRIFNGEPEIITGNLFEAIDHFSTTDFNEYTDVVMGYAENVRRKTPGSSKTGKYFF